MIALHVALALRRLGAEGEGGRRLGVALTEAFVVDMDDGHARADLRRPGRPRARSSAPPRRCSDRHAAYLAALAPASDMSLAEVLQAQLALLAPGGLDVSG